MRQAVISVIVVFLAATAAPLGAQRRAASGRVTFAVRVTDSSGAPLRGVLVTLTGPVKRSARAEMGRLAFENLPAGRYRFRFERQGFTPVERVVVGKRGAPIDVQVAMTRAAAEPASAAPATGSPARESTSSPVVLDLPAFIEKNYVGGNPGRTTMMACGEGATATLIQLNDPIREHVHADADEFVYVIAGQGTVRMSDRAESLSAGVFVLLPRGTPHAFAASGKSPLVMMSTMAGQSCEAAK